MVFLTLIFLMWMEDLTLFLEAEFPKTCVPYRAMKITVDAYFKLVGINRVCAISASTLHWKSNLDYCQNCWPSHVFFGVQRTWQRYASSNCKESSSPMFSLSFFKSALRFRTSTFLKTICICHYLKLNNRRKKRMWQRSRVLKNIDQRCEGYLGNTIGPWTKSYWP